MQCLESKLAVTQRQLSLLQKRNEALRVRLAALSLLLRVCDEVQQHRIYWGQLNSSCTSTSSSSGSGSGEGDIGGARSSDLCYSDRLSAEVDGVIVEGGCALDDVLHLNQGSLLKLEGWGEIHSGGKGNPGRMLWPSQPWVLCHAVDM